MFLIKLIKTRRFAPEYLERSTPGWIGHLPFAYWLAYELKPQILVELGTHFGNSYFTFCQSVSSNRLKTKCFAVDCWEGDIQAGEYGSTVFAQVSAKNQQYAGFSTLMRMRFDEALGGFDDGSIDLLHIDGLHTYEAVKHDFETWRPKLSPRAIVMFHDIAVQRDDFGVHRFWSELKKEYFCNLEFDHNYGMGVLFAKKHPCKYAWLKEGSFKKMLVKRMFRNRGIKLAVEYKNPI